MQQKCLGEWELFNGILGVTHSTSALSKSHFFWVFGIKMTNLKIEIDLEFAL